MSSDFRIPLLANALAAPSPRDLDRERLVPVLESLAHHPDFLRHCQTHGLAPIVCHTAKTLGLDGHLPRAFPHIYYRTLSDNLLYLNALSAISAACATRYPVIALKGPALIRLIYKNPALRPMSDLDLLVHPLDIGAFRTCLCDLGYVPARGHLDIFTREKIAIDLHADPLNAARIHTRSRTLTLDPEILWARAIPLPDMPRVHAFGPGDQIITLANHALKHGFNRKIWLIDVLRCLHASEETDTWQTILQQCRDARALPVLTWCLHAITAHLGHPLPARAENLQKSFPIGHIGLKMLYAGADSEPFQVLEPLVLLQNLENPSDKLRFLCEMAFPERTGQPRLSGHRAKSARTHLSRLIRLFSQGAVQIARICRHLALTKIPKPQSLFK